MAIRSYIDQLNEILIRWSMITKFPSYLIFIETAEELSAKRCDMQLIWICRNLNQLADDLANEKFDNFDSEFRIPLKGVELKWRVLDTLLVHADGSIMNYLREGGRRGPAKRFGKSQKAKSLVIRSLGS